MTQTLAQILQKSLENVERPASYETFTRSLERDPGRTPILPQVHESPENLGPAATPVLPTR